MIENLINKYKNPEILLLDYQITNFLDLIRLMQPLLDLHHIQVNFQRKGCKRSGAAVLKINQKTKAHYYTILIDSNCKDYAKCNILIHELMHILLDHLIKKERNNFYLPRKACEFVVDYIAETIIYNLTGLRAIDYQSEFSSALSIGSYRELWIKTAKINSEKISLIEYQISYGIELLSGYIKEQNENRL